MQSIVLSRRDWREYDQIISLYTIAEGKREAVARGIKKITSKNSSHLEPFFLVDVELLPGQEFDRLIRAQPIRIFKGIRSNLSRLQLAGMATTLHLMHLPMRQKDERLFNLLVGYLIFLDESRAVSSALPSAFMLRFLGLIGLTPSLNICVRCGQAVEMTASVFFSLSEGGIIHQSCNLGKTATIPSSAVFVLNVDERQHLQTLSDASWEEVALITIGKKIEQLIGNFLVYHSEKIDLNK